MPNSKVKALKSDKGLKKYSLVNPETEIMNTN